MKKSINKASTNKTIIIVIKDALEFNLGKCVLNIDLTRLIKTIGIGPEMPYVVFWSANHTINNVPVIKTNNKMSILLSLIACLLIYELVIANLKKESLWVLKFSLLTIEILLPIIYITKIKHVKNILLYKILYSNFLNIFSP